MIRKAATTHETEQDRRTHVVVVGAGFAGMSAVRALRRANVRVTLVDRNVYATFQPLLYQVATGGLNPGDVAYPARGFTARQHARFRRGTLTGIDAERRELTFADGGTLDYDYLILGTGVTTAHFGVPGAAEHALAIYTRNEALALRDRITGLLENVAEHPERRLDLVVVGGGPTGVEMAGALAELVSTGIKAGFPEIPREHVSVTLVERGDELITAFGPKLRGYALAQLRRRGIDVRLSTSVAEVTPSSVRLEDGGTLRADLTVWAAGISAPAEVPGWGLAQGSGGRITIDPDLRANGQQRIFVTGDIALRQADPSPQLAQPAIQMGRHAAKQILRLVEGRPTEPFAYHDKGNAATIGRNAAVIEFPRWLRLTGPLAWLGWVGLHVVMLLGMRNRISTLLNLAWRYVAWPRGGTLIVGDTIEPPSSDGAATGGASQPREATTAAAPRTAREPVPTTRAPRTTPPEAAAGASRAHDTRGSAAIGDEPASGSSWTITMRPRVRAGRP